MRGLKVGKITTITDALVVACPQCRAAVGEKCKNWRGSNCAPHRQRSHAASITPPPRGAVTDHEFDDASPLLRGRPIGQPVPRYVRLPPGESGLGTYRDWDSKGRIPAGSVLCQQIGTGAGWMKHSGFRVTGLPEWVDRPTATRLGAVGDLARPKMLDGYVVAVVIVEGDGTTLVVLAPKPEK